MSTIIPFFRLAEMIRFVLTTFTSSFNTKEFDTSYGCASVFIWKKKKKRKKKTTLSPGEEVPPLEVNARIEHNFIFTFWRTRVYWNKFHLFWAITVKQLLRPCWRCGLYDDYLLKLPLTKTFYEGTRVEINVNTNIVTATLLHTRDFACNLYYNTDKLHI